MSIMRIVRNDLSVNGATSTFLGNTPLVQFGIKSRARM